MKNLTQQRNKSLSLIIAVGLCAGVLSTLNFNSSSEVVLAAEKTQSYIIRSKDFEQLKNTINKLNVVPTHELKIINAVAVELSEAQLAELQKQIEVSVSSNHSVELSGVGPGQRQWQPAAVVNDFIGSNWAHSVGNYGAGVTMAFLDTGLTNLNGLGNDLYNNDKYWGTYNAVTDTASNSDWEANGHGTHVSSVAGNSDYDINGKIYGVAPNALMVGIKAFDNQGKASYADVIRGISWAVTYRTTYNIRVLNMSFSGPAQSNYWEDPLNLAVMAAWQSGIVIVASAGNKGPDPMTIGVPGNNPYIITVGAMTDSYTPHYYGDDKIAAFSSSGPTIEGFVKPEIIAPGGHMSGLMTTDSYLVTQHPEFHDGGRYFEMSGTSQAAAVVTGVVALMLNAEPNLSPDDVKCRLISTARTATNPDNSRAYSVFQQGAGVVSAYGALNSFDSGCANQGLDIAADLAGTKHFHGPANINSAGDFYVEGMGSDYVWDIPQDLNSSSGFVWKDTIKSASGFVWKDNFNAGNTLWNASTNNSTDPTWQGKFETDSGFVWKDSLTTSSGFVWKDNAAFTVTSEMIGVNSWVEAQ